MPDPLARPYWRGRRNVDAITIAAIEAAEKKGGHEFEITQGSYQSSVEQSAGTHDRGGAVDFAWCGHWTCLRALREVGFAAWHRTPAQGDWSHHVHAVLIDHPDLAPSAARQVTAYRNGRNGLANNGPDDGPRVNPIPVFKWPPVQEDDMFSDQDRELLQSVSTRLAGQGKRDVEWEQKEIARDRALTALVGRIEAIALRLEQALAKHDAG
jgi:hypothetical protein